MMSHNVLVVYYSFEGSTKAVAEAVADAVNADILELKPVKELQTHGFMKYIWGGRQAVMKQKPGLLPLERNPNDYDIIVIGTPVWAFTFSPPVRSFISMTNLKNKKIALLCCHEGSPGRTLHHLKKELSGNEFIGEIDLTPAKDKEKSITEAIRWAKRILSDL